MSLSNGEPLSKSHPNAQLKAVTRIEKEYEHK